jgi:sugar phosphate isomerase/epimerase
MSIKISAVTDEISADPETAIELGTQWGISDFELRGFFTDRVPVFSSYQKRHLQDILQAYGARIIAVSPGIFKTPFPAKTAPRASLSWLEKAGYDQWMQTKRLVDHHLNELLPQSLDYANELGAQWVLIFGFDRSAAPAGEPPEEILEYLFKAAERAKAAGLKLLVENEAGFWADTGERTSWIIRTIDHPALGVNWDPGNAFYAGDVPYPDGFLAVRGFVQHVHFKDASWDEHGDPYYCEEGEIDWDGQVQHLIEAGYDGYISIETHMSPKIAAARAALIKLRHLLEPDKTNLQTFSY